ncbi:carboxypeptidase regulatory-like domain-containing protein [Candidatus Woesearchaeota archaeon]|nr:carboxypeptidase regulatory-like domain-containing protein [Candidatus Woesearchaeota archaeon]
MTSKKRGMFYVVLALCLILLAPLAFNPVNAAVNGCYTYSKASEDLYCASGGILEDEAKADCVKYPDCKIDQHFIPGSDCSDIDDCKEITCKVDCKTHTWGKCQQLAGAGVSDLEVPAEEYEAWCNPGCCKFTPTKGAKDFCQFNLNQYQCTKQAALNGVTDSQKIIFDNSAGMNLNLCAQTICKLQITPSDLTIFVKDSNEKGIEGVKIVLQGEAQEKTTDSSGKVTFSKLTPKTYLVKATKDGFLSASATIPLASNLSKTYNFTLVTAEGTASVSGTITDTNGAALNGATLSWTGVTEGKTTADASGKFSASTLPPGTYTFTASIIGYKPSIQAATLEAKVPATLDFKLEKSALQGITGTTYLDSNDNTELDAGDQPIAGAKIYVDGIFKGLSIYPEGKFEISVEVKATEGKETHKLSAVYQDYNAEIEVELTKGETLSQNLLLVRYLGECSKGGVNEQKDVEAFYAVPVPGKKEVQLNWNKPCPEVIGYGIEKCKAEECSSIPLPPTANAYTDTEVEWEAAYSYKIWAVYDYGLSKNMVEQAITLGSELCAGRYHELTGWETFCFGKTPDERKKVWTCDDGNKLIGSKDCGEMDGTGENYYCARVAEGVAECKNTGSCGLFGNPFGLYYNSEMCYGSMVAEGAKPANYCYYEYTNTVVEQCKSCTQVNSCFDYQSQDACEVNSCLSKDCTWLNAAQNEEPIIDYGLILPGLVTPETGAGYCVEKDYTKDDKCSLCSPSASLFDNYFCTAQICTNLGNCFASAGLKYCQSCGEAPTKDTNCYSYGSKLECVGSDEGEEAGIYKDPSEHITASKDKCSWKRCRWEGNSGTDGKCIKDGNVDEVDDCEAFADVGSANTCRMDNSPPKTVVEPAGVNVVSLAHPNITFFGNDKYHKYANQQSDMGALGYCLTSGDPTASDSCVRDNEGNSAFIEVPYAGKLPEEYLTVDLINSKYLAGQSIEGDTYKLKFYSQDKYFNQEDLQETFVFVDNVVPEFEIKDTQETTADITDLTITLEGIDEPLECKFDLISIVPQGSVQTQTVARETELKEVKFEGLTGVKYDLNVTCKDDHDNTNTKNATYVFDLEQNIDVIEPALKGVIAATDIVFKIHTDVGAICALYLADTNEKITDFIPNEEGKEHYTNTVVGFTEGKYTGTHKIVCTDLLNGEVMEDYFDFTVDFTPPTTQITLKEGKREVKPIDYGWEEYFISSVNIDFECTADGFGCSKTFYCLGVGCELIGSPEYKEYTGTVALNETSQICYYSTDAGDSMVFSPLCGKIVVDGYGITLEQPPPYFYQGEVWGISNLPVFNWGFFTKVPTKECGFDFTSGIDYMSLPDHKKKPLNSEQKYLFENFPQSVLTSYAEDGGTKAVYVKCLNHEDEIGPEKKMNLEYDPTPPEITEAYAKPNLVLEEIFTNLFTVTDDKTLCKFSDNSEGAGSNEYYTMEFPFPGLESNTLNITHQAEFGISDVGDDGMKDYSLFVQCQNGAENLSNVKDINFSVDYTAVGYIIASSLAPGGYVTIPDVTLKAETSKTGLCEFRENVNQSYTQMDGAGGKLHGSVLSKLPEGAHKFLVRCAMGDHVAEAAIDFIIDLTPPTIKEINDGNRTCGQDKLSVSVYTDDANVTGYYYELYDAGEDKNYIVPAPAVNTSKSLLNASKLPVPKAPIPKINASLSAPKSGATLVGNGTLPSSFPLEIPAPVGINILGANASGGNASGVNASSVNASGFIVGHKYVVKVKAQDAAGNWGGMKESDGVTATYKNYSACIADITAPKVTMLLNDNCTLNQPVVELHCEDENGCTGFKYGKSSTSACNATLSYTGTAIPVDKKSWLCYYVADTKGQNISETKPVLIVDDDGDGIVNKCDQCLLTPAGKVADKSGCASNDTFTGQNKTVTDIDNDGLPDDWEKKYDAENCEFDYTKKDSDGDTIADSMEDYDGDGLSNHKEYTLGTNPCIKELIGPKIEPGKLGSEQNKTNVTKLPSEEETLLPVEEGNLVAWILLIIGLLLTFGGSGYLIYYYKYAPAPTRAVSGPVTSTSRITPSAGEGVVNALRSKLTLLRQGRDDRLKQRSREDVFGKFTSKSTEIPHVGPVLSSKASPIEKVQQAAQKYVEHKEEIKSGLKAGEKGIFSKLEGIAKQGKAPEITTTEAKDIFSQLKELSKKRKEVHGK